MTVHAKLAPPRDALYRFDFGDGSRIVEQGSADATHLYSSGGMYRVEVRAAAGDEEVKEHLFVTVPDQGVPPFLYGLLGLVALLAGGMFYYFFKQEKEEKREENEEGAEGSKSTPLSGNDPLRASAEERPMEATGADAPNPGADDAAEEGDAGSATPR